MALTIPPNEPTERETNDSPQREREKRQQKNRELPPRDGIVLGGGGV
jgi:hypothetical protein